MAGNKRQSGDDRGRSEKAWSLTERQHGIIARRQLLGIGFSSAAIEHRLRRGRLHPVHRGVYAVGRKAISDRSRWMAAVLACGKGAALSHGSAAALWRLGYEPAGTIEVSIPTVAHRKRRMLTVHRRPTLNEGDVISEYGIAVTSPVKTLIDVACRLDLEALEQAINEADKHDLVNPVALHKALDGHPGDPGVGRLRTLLDPQTFRPTRSYLERRFLPVAAKAGLPLPQTKAWVNGFEVDFYWPDLGLVIESDGLRYHRTPTDQGRALLRDQAHLMAGMTPLRFSYEQIRYQPAYVGSVLEAIGPRLASFPPHSGEKTPVDPGC